MQSFMFRSFWYHLMKQLCSHKNQRHCWKKLKCVKDKVCHFLINITDLHSIEWDSQTLECWDCAILTWNHICSFEKISSLVLANKRMYMYMQYVSLQAYLDTMKMLSTFKTSFKVGLLSKADKVTDVGNFCPVIL